MNANEARVLAAKTVADEQKAMIEIAMAAIRRAAEQGNHQVSLSTCGLSLTHIDWLATYLRGEGYAVKDVRSQREGSELLVSWYA